MAQPPINRQTTLTNIDLGNGCNQGIHCLTGFMSKSAMQPKPRMSGPRGHVSRTSLLHCQCQRQQLLAKLDYIMQLRFTLHKQLHVNSVGFAQARISAMAMDTTSNVFNVSKDTARGFHLLTRSYI